MCVCVTFLLHFLFAAIFSMLDFFKLNPLFFEYVFSFPKKKHHLLSVYTPLSLSLSLCLFFANQFIFPLISFSFIPSPLYHFLSSHLLSHSKI